MGVAILDFSDGLIFYILTYRKGATKKFRAVSNDDDDDEEDDSNEYRYDCYARDIEMRKVAE